MPTINQIELIIIIIDTFICINHLENRITYEADKIMQVVGMCQLVMLDNM